MCNLHIFIHLPSLYWLVWLSLWYGAHGPSSGSQCDSWEEGAPLHRCTIKADFNEGKLITALVTDAGWSVGDANLCLCHSVGHNQSERKINDRTRRGEEGDFQWFTCCSYIDRQACSSLTTAVVILGPKRLRPSDSCPAKGEVLPPVWPQKGSCYPERAISGASQLHEASPDDRMAFCSDLISIQRMARQDTNKNVNIFFRQRQIHAA